MACGLRVRRCTAAKKRSVVQRRRVQCAKRLSHARLFKPNAFSVQLDVFVRFIKFRIGSIRLNCNLIVELELLFIL